MNDLTLQQGYDLFISDRETFCESTTIRNYKNNIRYFLSFMESYKDLPSDKILLNCISKDDLKQYTLYLRNKPKFEGHPFNITMDKGITKRSIKTYQVDIRTFFNFLYNEEYIQVNLTRGYKIIKPESKLLVPLTVEDVANIDKLFNIKTELGCRNLCIFHLMLDAGLRSSEVMNLTTQNINLRDDVIFVSHGKGAKDRTLPLTPILKKYLNNYLIIFRPLVSHNYFLCSSTDHEQLTKDGLKSLFARVKKKIGLQRLYPHLLRHTFATSYILGGGDLETLRIYMGHTDISTTQKYLHIASQHKFNNNIYKLDKKFFKRYY
jgi:integrase/recombinase XerC/integrase/recombinase XerD